MLCAHESAQPYGTDMIVTMQFTPVKLDRRLQYTENHAPTTVSLV